MLNIIEKLLPTPSDHSPEQTASLRKNLHMHLADGSLYVFGMSLISVPTIFPIFIKELGGSAIAIGSVQVLWMIGLNIPAAFVAQYLQRRAFFKPAMVKWGFVHRFMLFISGATVLIAVGNISSAFAVSLFLLLLFLTAAFGSVAGLPWFQVYTKTVPVKLRGRLMGIRQLLGSAAGAVGGSIVGLVLYAVVFPINFALLFFGAFIVTLFSFYFISKIAEQPTEVGETEQKKFNILHEARTIIRSNKNFRHFLIADAFILMSVAASSFYSVYAVEKFSLPSSSAGTFTAIVMLTSVVANIAFGIIADSFGHKVNLLAFAFCSAMASLLAILSPNIFMYGFVFFFLACSIQVQAISRLHFVAEMCKESDRPVYVGIANTLTAPTVLVGILFGWLVPKIGYRSVFGITALLAVSAVILLHRFVKDPRKI